MIEIEFFSYFFVLLSVYGLWIFKKRAVYGFAALALIISWVSNVIDIFGFTMISSYTFLVMSYYKHENFRPIKWLLFITIVIFSLLLMKSQIQGISNWQIIDNEFIGDGAVKYSLFLNIDRAAVAIAIGLFALSPIRHVSHLKAVLKDILPITAIALFLLASLGMATGTIDLNPKVPDLWLIWMIVNLATVCISQELFLRTFLQHQLMHAMPKSPLYHWIAIVICSVFFALLFPPHPNVYFMTFVAGLFYGYAYLKTARVEASILLHFTVNVIHFFCFTYPYLNSPYLYCCLNLSLTTILSFINIKEIGELIL